MRSSGGGVAEAATVVADRGLVAAHARDQHSAGKGNYRRYLADNFVFEDSKSRVAVAVA